MNKEFNFCLNLILTCNICMGPSNSARFNMVVTWIVNVGLAEDFPSLAGDLKDQPSVVLQSIGLAVSQVFCV